ncbi:hypothetical protein [Saccharothrix yanglingensis]|uniref:Uncharacterized protein n=1 Tax=Saccharothrix yanglingensis TaxID=659496 RepID=A0ABU0X687_9PSEU|nr:hypothetical protein [Saccharothrix yanglingensis]MDQ2587651.1 hypothetical protein [Saccharothrix yanglingensis]
MVRVRGVEDAQRVRGELREERDEVVAVRSAPGRPTSADAPRIVAEAGDRIELDFDRLEEARARLDQLQDVLVEQLRQAQDLGEPIGDGKGPVALHMRRAFRERGGAVGGGVQVALKSYLDELVALRDALGQVGATHRAEDAMIAEAMRRQG